MITRVHCFKEMQSPHLYQNKEENGQYSEYKPPFLVSHKRSRKRLLQTLLWKQRKSLYMILHTYNKCFSFPEIDIKEIEVHLKNNSTLNYPSLFLTSLTYFDSLISCSSCCLYIDE